MLRFLLVSTGRTLTVHPPWWRSEKVRVQELWRWEFWGEMWPVPLCICPGQRLNPTMGFCTLALHPVSSWLQLDLRTMDSWKFENLNVMSTQRHSYHLKVNKGYFILEPNVSDHIPGTQIQLPWIPHSNLLTVSWNNIYLFMCVCVCMSVCTCVHARCV